MKGGTAELRKVANLGNQGCGMLWESGEHFHQIISLFCQNLTNVAIYAASLPLITIFILNMIEITSKAGGGWGTFCMIDKHFGQKCENSVRKSQELFGSKFFENVYGNCHFV